MDSLQRELRNRIVMVLLGAAALLAMTGGTARAAAPSRPVTGIGILVMRSLNPDISVDTMMLPLYDEPGLRRIGTTRPSALPHLSAVLARDERDEAVAVLQKRSNWLRIAYDDAGREGWVEQQRSWQFATWDNWLKGRVAQFLPGIPKQYLRLLREPSVAAPPLDTPVVQKQLRIIRAKDDWLQVLVDGSVMGWVRWRDGDDRFLVQIKDRFSQLKR